MQYQPVYGGIRGITPGLGDVMPKDQVAGLNDWFGNYLRSTPYESRPYTLRDLLQNAKVVPPRTWRPFAVCDGITIPYDDTGKKTTADGSTKLNDVPRHLRFVVTCAPTDPDPDSSVVVKGSTGHIKLRGGFCVVGSAEPDSSEAFLQVASWQANAYKDKLGYFRYYERTAGDSSPSGRPEWVYVGSSMDAFGLKTSGLGPFDGHVGGALVMKELRSPWFHWVSQVTDSGQLIVSLGRNAAICKDPLFTTNFAFDNLGGGEELEALVTDLTTAWYDTRAEMDFYDPTTGQPRETITAVKSWMAHILQSYAINLATSNTDSETVWSSKNAVNGIPHTFFFNAKGLENVIPGIDGGSSPDAAGKFDISFAEYEKTIALLRTSVVAGWRQDDKGNQTPIVVQEGSEGQYPFPIVEPGLDDYAAIGKLVDLQKSSKPVELLPLKAIACFLMVDYCNPMYSPTRERLFQLYVPDSTSKVPAGSPEQYDLLSTMVKGMKAAIAADPQGAHTQAEGEFLRLLDFPDETWQADFKHIVGAYMAKVQNRLKPDAEAGSSGAQEYLVLAESRRRLYRSREDEKKDGSGLNEFALTLPYSLNESLFGVWYHMTENGEVVVDDKDQAKAFYAKVAGRNSKEATQGTRPFCHAALACDASSKRALDTLRHADKCP